MVFEGIVSMEKLERKPWELFFMGLFWTAFACGISLFLFPEYSSLVSVTFTVMMTLPFVYSSLSYEEELYHDPKTELGLLKAHTHLFTCFLALFLGILSAYFLWFTIPPTDITSTLFQAQTATITDVNTPTGHFGAVSTFMEIFWHNTQILLVSLLLAFFLGAGPIFILTWNASVIAAAIGNQFTNGISLIQEAGGYLRLSENIQTVAFPFYRYLIHGIPEILAYIIGGLAGGLISIAVIRHSWGDHHFVRTMEDAGILFMASLLLLFVAAIIEVKVLATI